MTLRSSLVGKDGPLGLEASRTLQRSDVSKAVANTHFFGVNTNFMDSLCNPVEQLKRGHI